MRREVAVRCQPFAHEAPTRGLFLLALRHFGFRLFPRHSARPPLTDPGGPILPIAILVKFGTLAASKCPCAFDLAMNCVHKALGCRFLTVGD